MARACILMALAPVKVPAAWLLSLSTASSPLEWSRPRGLPTPSPEMTLSVSSRSAARVKALPKKPVIKAASVSISSVA